MEQDIKKGILPYYRTWHQLNENTVCAVHGVPLLVLRKRGPLSEDAVIQSAVWEDMKGKEDAESAERIKGLFVKPLRLAYEDWRNRIPKGKRHKMRLYRIMAFQKAWVSDIHKRELIIRIPCALCGGSFYGHVYMTGRYDICPSCRMRLGSEETERTILSMRNDYRVVDGHIVHSLCGQEFRGKTLSPSKFLWDGVECGCLKKNGSLRIHKRSFDNDEFTVTGYSFDTAGYRVIQVRHKLCGNDFWIKPAYFKKARYCRICQRQAYRFTEKVCAMTDGEYEVLKEPSSLGYKGSDTILRHVRCGTVFSNRARNFLEGQRCPFCCIKPGADKVVRLVEQNCDVSQYELQPNGVYIHVTMPDGSTKRLRCAQALQELTRFDEPELFIRKNRISQPVSDKARLYFYYRDKYKGGEMFTTENGSDETGVPLSSYYSAMSQLVKQGRLIRVQKGVYRLAEEFQDHDSGNVPSL